MRRSSSCSNHLVSTEEIHRNAGSVLTPAGEESGLARKLLGL